MYYFTNNNNKCYNLIEDKNIFNFVIKRGVKSMKRYKRKNKLYIRSIEFICNRKVINFVIKRGVNNGNIKTGLKVNQITFQTSFSYLLIIHLMNICFHF